MMWQTLLAFLVSLLCINLVMSGNPLHNGVFKDGNCLLLGVVEGRRNFSLEVDLLRDQVMILADIDLLAEPLVDSVVPLEVYWSVVKIMIIFDKGYMFHRFVQTTMKNAECAVAVSTVTKVTGIHEEHEHR